MAVLRSSVAADVSLFAKVLGSREKARLMSASALSRGSRALGLDLLVGNGSAVANDSVGEESEFPADLFTEEQRKQGAVVLHVVLAVYCFAAIATVCTEHFLPTIRCICQDLKLSDDVAAATFMSAATSSPELFTNVIGTFVTRSDIGVGHVLGNAYFDMFFVAALGGLAAKQDVLLDWWPIARDCVVYLVVASVLTGIVWDGTVTVGETAILLALHGLYFIVMFSNRRIIGFCRERFGLGASDPVDGDAKSLPGRNNLDVQEEALNPTEAVAVSQTPPKDESRVWAIAGKAALRPLLVLIGLTIPDVRKERLRRYYPLAFVLCVAWIGMSTYLGTWMISTIGETIGVPDSVMGMVFMAAGGSVVEACAVFYKVRKGECSIGLSNSMGCNTLDITLCMALPWFVRCAMPAAGSASKAVVIRSPGIQFNCLLLVACVVLLFGVLSVNKFKLNKASGTACGIVYVSVLGIAILNETH